MKKIITSLAIASVLASGLYAWNGGGPGWHHGGYDKGAGFKRGYGYNENQGYGRNCGYNNNGMNAGPRFFNMFSNLNLTADQKLKIKNIIKESRANQELPCDSFTKDSFDKAKFIKAMKQKRDNQIERQAEIMDKVYKILDKNQKEQLRVLMDLRKQNMQRAFEE